MLVTENPEKQDCKDFATLLAKNVTFLFDYVVKDSFTVLCLHLITTIFHNKQVLYHKTQNPGKLKLTTQNF